jgi:hypothetical protein
MTADSLSPGASDRLGYFKLPGYIAFVESLPVTATQKRRYDAVAELARSFLNGGNAGLFDVRHTKRNHRPAR